MFYRPSFLTQLETKADEGGGTSEKLPVFKLAITQTIIRQHMLHYLYFYAKFKVPNYTFSIYMYNKWFNNDANSDSKKSEDKE